MNPDARSEVGSRHAPSDERRIRAYWVFFNVAPSRYLHPSWHSCFVADPLGDWVFGGERGHAPLSLAMLKRLDLENCYCGDWTSPAMQVALDTWGDDLDRLAMLLGLLAIAPEVRRALGRHEVGAWQEALGDASYRFTCYQAPLLGVDWWEPLGRPAAIRPGTPGQTAETVRAFGYALLWGLARNMPRPFAERMRLRFPRTVVERPGGFIPEAVSAAFSQTRSEEGWSWIQRMWRRQPVRAFASTIRLPPHRASAGWSAYSTPTHGMPI
jgi:hypothetical protein